MTWMTYCDDCELHHAIGACEQVAELRWIYRSITPEQLALSLGAQCEWRANECHERATHRVQTYVEGSSLVIEDRLLCEGHASITDMAAHGPGFKAEMTPLADPTDPKLEDAR